MLMLFIPLVFLIHYTEEWFFGFPEWAVKHFGTITTRKFFLLSHIPLAIVAICIPVASTLYPGSISLLFGSEMIQTILFTNALFHLGASAKFRDYSPGAVTSALVILPFSFYFYGQLHERFPLDSPFSVAALVFGTAISALIVYSLNWRKII